MATNTDSEQMFSGKVTFYGPTILPAACIGGTQMNPSDPVPVAAVSHRFEPRLAQAFGAAAVAERRVVHHANRAGGLSSVSAGAVLPNVGAATYTVDVYKNGVTMLIAPLVVTSATVAYGSVTATLAVTTFAAGDVIEVVLTVAAGGGTLAQGVFVKPVIYELP